LVWPTTDSGVFWTTRVALRGIGLPKLLEMHGITKRFPGVVALSGVDLELERGQVHVLVGENGAGKSTLIKILAGVYRPDEGVISVDGRRRTIPSAVNAQRLGIATIYQEFNLVPQMTVAENVFLGRQPHRHGLINQRAMRGRTGELLKRLDVDVDPDETVANLGVAKRQMVEIAKALSLDARILIMDEPTATLSETETKTLFEAVRRLKSEGVGIIFISHRLEEIKELGDRVTVLRDGKVVGRGAAAMDRDDIIQMMVGRPIGTQYPRRAGRIGDPVLEVQHLWRHGVLRDISFVVRAGEVLGIAGLLGAGRTELVRAIFGADVPDRGRIEVAGRELRLGDLTGARRGGLALVPEDRQAQGLILALSVRDNLTMVNLRDDSSFGLVDDAKLDRDARRMIDGLSIRVASMDQPARLLSGGNQQKVVIGKWLLAESRVLILDEPTRGIDVGAKNEIYELMNELTGRGVAIVMISSDLREVLGMSDRILVMRDGRITGEVSKEGATQERIMHLATHERDAAVG
jgi:ribose transport system ATP-binding protein